MPEVIALDHVSHSVALFREALRFRVPESDVRSLLRTDLYSESSCFKPAISALSFAISLFAASKAFCNLDSFFSGCNVLLRKPWTGDSKSSRSNGNLV